MTERFAHNPIGFGPANTMLYTYSFLGDGSIVLFL